jgi:hypothetical protein
VHKSAAPPQPSAAACLPRPVVVGIHARVLDEQFDEPTWANSVLPTFTAAEWRQVAGNATALREQALPPSLGAYLDIMQQVKQARPSARFFVCSNRYEAAAHQRLPRRLLTHRALPAAPVPPSDAAAAALVKAAQEHWDADVAFAMPPALAGGTDRGMAAGAQRALAAWALLSATSLVVGPYWSSFSDEAAVAGGVQKVMIRRATGVHLDKHTCTSISGHSALVDPLWSVPGCGTGGHASANHRRGGLLNATNLTPLRWFEQLWGIKACGQNHMVGFRG